ncbi:hypothetical protein RR46_05353 [Papilio xuthus]|uniref:Uncharacterized protein n=1 Tax=Papilio xuthus TaxID=66420 RepID=A0A194Q6C9_PAPXU|nr:hypothetical protein RR46_05353 [Papilio xuthus]
MRPYTRPTTRAAGGQDKPVPFPHLSRSLLNRHHGGGQLLVHLWRLLWVRPASALDLSGHHRLVLRALPGPGLVFGSRGFRPTPTYYRGIPLSTTRRRAMSEFISPPTRTTEQVESNWVNGSGAPQPPLPHSAALPAPYAPHTASHDGQERSRPADDLAARVDGRARLTCRRQIKPANLFLR